MAAAMTIEEKQGQLKATVEGLGTAKFGLADVTVPVEAVIADASKYVLMDTRSEEEMAVGMIPGAITKAEFEAEPEKYKEKEVVAYCTVGYISGACAYELRKKGHTNVKNMGDGALLGYTLAKTSAGVEKPLVKPDGSATNEVHTFMDALAPLAGDGMVGRSFADPPAMLEAANASIKERTGL
jgi:rhodanese-related sulfurtransferase